MQEKQRGVWGEGVAVDGCVENQVVRVWMRPVLAKTARHKLESERDSVSAQEPNKFDVLVQPSGSKGVTEMLDEGVKSRNAEYISCT